FVTHRAHVREAEHGLEHAREREVAVVRAVALQAGSNAEIEAVRRRGRSVLLLCGHAILSRVRTTLQSTRPSPDPRVALICRSRCVTCERSKQGPCSLAPRSGTHRKCALRAARAPRMGTPCTA